MLPNIKFEVIGMKLSEISPFENQYFSIPKNVLQADSVQVTQIRAPNVEKCDLGIILSTMQGLNTHENPASKRNDIKYH